MAKIEVIGFVSNWKFDSDEPNPSWAMKVNEPHSKNVGTREQPKWEKIGSTTYTVKNAYGQDVDFSVFGQGERVEIVGILTSEKWQSGDKSGINFIIKASSVDRLSTGITEPRTVGTHENTSDYDPEAPF